MLGSRLLLAATVVGLALTGTASARVKGVTQRQLQEQACYNDAMTLCKDAVPDEAKITVCMTAKRSQLSPMCGKVFDEGEKAR